MTEASWLQLEPLCLALVVSLPLSPMCARCEVGRREGGVPGRGPILMLQVWLLFSPSLTLFSDEELF